MNNINNNLVTSNDTFEAAVAALELKFANTTKSENKMVQKPTIDTSAANNSHDRKENKMDNGIYTIVNNETGEVLGSATNYGKALELFQIALAAYYKGSNRIGIMPIELKTNKGWGLSFEDNFVPDKGYRLSNGETRLEKLTSKKLEKLEKKTKYIEPFNSIPVVLEVKHLSKKIGKTSLHETKVLRYDGFDSTKPNYVYDDVADALEELKDEGYVFTPKGNFFICNQ